MQARTRLPANAVLSVLWLATCAVFAPPCPGQSALRDLNTHCPFNPPVDRAAWEARAHDVRLQLQVSTGMFPIPELDPVSPNIYGLIRRDDYTIEKVTFESLPGLYVTGNLYRPTDTPAGQALPGVLCPHGHWQDARFYAASEPEIKQLLASGAERFETAARNHIQARCVQLARMGCVVFHWDMLGYCDSMQINHERAHRFASQAAEHAQNADGWLLYSPLAEAHCQSVLGLQTLATRRATEMLLSLPEIDPERIAITGASGGGTQSFVGAALDQRIRIAFPAVMVSTGMQGGCTCENACLLRTGTGNVELAALIAPRPLGLTAADDWTRTMPEDGYPELQKLYELVDAPSRVQLFPELHFGHNFNHVCRTHLYTWINQQFQLGQEAPVLERDFELASRDELTVWDSDHPQPPGGEAFERRLLGLWAEIVHGQMDGLLKGDRFQIAQLHQILHSGWRVCLGLTTKQLDGQLVRQDDRMSVESLHDGSWILSPEATDRQTSAAAQQYVRIRVESGDETSVWLFPTAVDGPQPLVDNPRLAAAYTYAYNLPQFSQAARRLGLTLRLLHQHQAEVTDSTNDGNGGQRIRVSGTGLGAALAAAGVLVAQDGTDEKLAFQLQLAPDTFEFGGASSIRDPGFLPGAVRYWDLPGLVSCLRHTDMQIADDNAEAFKRLARLVHFGGSRLQTDPR